MKFTIIKSCLARFSGTFAVGTPSNIHGVALSYRCAKFGAFVNSVTILTLRDLTITFASDQSFSLRGRDTKRFPTPKTVKVNGYKLSTQGFLGWFGWTSVCYDWVALNTIDQS